MTAVCATAQTPYITEVLDYSPAPGQFVNVYPPYEQGDTRQAMLDKCLDLIGGTADRMVSLGSFGGSITFAFDHMVPNVPGEYDFKVMGNSFFKPNAQNGDGGNSEPGIIMVSHDANGNGLADDPWYEIAGSEYGTATATDGYEVTYTRPAADHQPVLDPEQTAFSDIDYISWTDNKGNSGKLPKLVEHTQSYFPEWDVQPSYTFSGTRLAGNARLEGSRIKEWVLYPYAWGYADNVPNDEPAAGIKIEWAVKPDGSKADLPGINFVRVYTSQLEVYGALGEVSTEVCGAVDLHALAGIDAATADRDGFFARHDGERLYLTGVAAGTEVAVSDMQGRTVARMTFPQADAAMPCRLNSGIYVVRSGARAVKLMVRQR